MMRICFSFYFSFIAPVSGVPNVWPVLTARLGLDRGEGSSGVVAWLSQAITRLLSARVDPGVLRFLACGSCRPAASAWCRFAAGATTWNAPRQTRTGRAPPWNGKEPRA